jgi:hypothetical protein
MFSIYHHHQIKLRPKLKNKQIKLQKVMKLRLNPKMLILTLLLLLNSKINNKINKKTINHYNKSHFKYKNHLYWNKLMLINQSLIKTKKLQMNTLTLIIIQLLIFKSSKIMSRMSTLRTLKIKIIRVSRFINSIHNYKAQLEIKDNSCY